MTGQKITPNLPEIVDDDSILLYFLALFVIVFILLSLKYAMLSSRKCGFGRYFLYLKYETFSHTPFYF